MNQKTVNEPLFSIVVPNYNGAEFINQAVNSLITQSDEDREIIVIDDGSTDNSLEILKTFNDQITLLTQEKKGSELARNSGILKAKGRYIVAVDSDDILLPYALDVYHAIIDYFDYPPVIIANYQRFKSEAEINYNGWDSKYIKCVEVKDYFKKNIHCPSMNPVFIIRRDVLIKVGLYHLNYFGFEDNQLLFRLGLESPLIKIFNPITVAYRIHERNSSKNIPVLTDGALAFIDYERKNGYPGGKKRLIDRRGLIGTNMISFIYHYILTNSNLPDNIKLQLAAKILLKVRSMPLVGIIRKVQSFFYFSKEHLIEFNHYT